MLNTNIVIQYGARNRKLRKNGFSSYQKYLKSDQWKSVKLKWQKKRAQKSIYWSKCNCCGTNENLILHHLRYGKIGSSCKLGGIVPVCMRCHNEIHKMAHNPAFKGGLKKATSEWRNIFLKIYK